MDRREFHKLLGLGAAAGLSLPSLLRARPQTGDAYHLPRFGNVHLMHMTDVHAQLLPVHYREPSVNIGVHDARNRPPHLVGEALSGVELPFFQLGFGILCVSIIYLLYLFI